ncbi:hypothetical protein J3A83DRAFT_4356789 [Scleroderma citrinum]
MSAAVCTTAVYYGPVINPESLTNFHALPRCLIAVSPDGNIAWIEDDVIRSELEAALGQHGLLQGDYILTELKPGEFIMPGFIDTHIHACQVPNLGVGGEDQLLDWLNNYTFPTEARFKDMGYATRVYPDIVNRVINSGTTTSCYYATLHLEATKILADVIHEKGQRAFVGKCNMDRNSPDYYVEPSAEESLESTEALIDYIQGLPRTPSGEALVHPIITPRFAISCTDKLLTELGDFAESVPDIPIQTHISENPKEIEETLELFPNASSYADVYDQFKLLRNNTILGHGVYLTDDELQLIVTRGAGVAHCPASNFNLSSGMAKVGKMLDYGVKVGLGTDVSGGNNPSMLYTIQMASTTSKMVAIQSTGEEEEGTFTNKRLDTATLLYLATLGGADVCCLKHRIGSFSTEKAFDALLVSVRDDTGNPAVWGYNQGRDPTEEPHSRYEDKDLKEWFQRFFYCGDDRNIRRVFVQGALIGGQEFQG